MDARAAGRTQPCSGERSMGPEGSSPEAAVSLSDSDDGQLERDLEAIMDEMPAGGGAESGPAGHR
eukprot:2515031-Alexandrium_andersonii.AAC.1